MALLFDVVFNGIIGSISAAGSLLILLAPFDCHCWETSVVSIKDGDTITVSSNINEQEKVKIRLYGIDAPELNQEYGVESSFRTSSCARSLLKV